MKYPAAPSDNTVDEYFGMKVADPYRPLENDTADATTAWVNEENALTQDYLSEIPFREALRKRISSFNNYVKQGTPWKDSDNRYYFYRNDGLKTRQYFTARHRLTKTRKCSSTPTPSLTTAL